MGFNHFLSLAVLPRQQYRKGQPQSYVKGAGVAGIALLQYSLGTSNNPIAGVNGINHVSGSTRFQGMFRQRKRKLLRLWCTSPSASSAVPCCVPCVLPWGLSKYYLRQAQIVDIKLLGG